jgi:hypothetical protein
MPSIFDKLFKGKTSASPATATPHAYDTLFAQAAGVAAAKNLERAVQLYGQAIAADPSRAEAYYKRGNALKDLGRLEAAIASYDEAIERNSDYVYAYCNRGTLQHALGRMAASLASYDRALALEPKDALTHYNRALLLQECDRWDEALAAYDASLAIDPDFADAQYNRALASLYLGNFERGWRGYEWRWKNAQRLGLGEARGLRQPLWLGAESIAGKRLLLYSEAGLGDTLQFCRYATLCAARGATVILEVPAPLLDLLGTLEGVSDLIATGSLLPPFDYQCPLMSLPLAYKTTPDTIPAPHRYLHGDADKVARWRHQLGGRVAPRIGLAWSGNPNNPIDRRRSIPLAEWLPHLPAEFQYFCLQTQVREADAEALDASESVFSFDPDALDFAGTAALCECMDLVLTVDTSLAHLGGALGQRTWTLLPFTPDWRWLRSGEKTPWYPSMTLYRQKNAGAWEEVFARVAADLRREFSGR